MKMITIGIVIGMLLYFGASSILLKINNKIIVDKPVYKEQALTDLEKEYPISDSHGNRFKTMPTVYSNTYLTKGLSKDGYYYPPNILTVTYSPLWAEGKFTGFTQITEHSYQPFYEDTAQVYEKVDYIYTKNILKWKTKEYEWTKFEPLRWGYSLAPITKVTTYSHTRLVELMTPIIDWGNSDTAKVKVTTSPVGLSSLNVTYDDVPKTTAK